MMSNDTRTTTAASTATTAMTTDNKSTTYNNNKNNNDDDETDEAVNEILHRLQEENFELQATIATIQAERDVEVSMLRQEAAAIESKYRAELRLAQQQQQQQEVHRYNSNHNHHNRRSGWTQHQQQQQQQQLPTNSTVSSNSFGWQQPQQHPLSHGDFRTRTTTTTPLNPDYRGTGTSTRASFTTTDHANDDYKNNDNGKENTVDDVDGKKNDETYKNNGTNQRSKFGGSNAIHSCCFCIILTSHFFRCHRNRQAKKQKKSFYNVAASAAAVDNHNNNNNLGNDHDNAFALPAPASLPQQPPTTNFHPNSHLASNLLTHTTTQEATTSLEMIQQQVQDSHIRQVLIRIACETSLTTTTTWTEESLIEWLIGQTPITTTTAANITHDAKAKAELSSQAISTSIKTETDHNCNVICQEIQINDDDHHTNKYDATTTTTTTTNAVAGVSAAAADKYWILAMSISPAARQHVVRRVMQEKIEEEGEELPSSVAATIEPPPSKMEIDHDDHDDDDHDNNSSKSNKHTPQASASRIQPLKQQQQQQELFYARLDAARKALRNPFWDPHRHGTNPIPYTIPITTTPWSTTGSSSNCKSKSTMTTRTIKFRQFVQFLASSCYTRHLRTLQLMLQEVHAVVGDIDAAASSAALQSTSNNNNYNTPATKTIVIWWDLCYKAIVKTIQRLIYQKLWPQSLPSQENNNISNNSATNHRVVRSSSSSRKGNSNNNNSTRTDGTTKDDRPRRYRINHQNNVQLQVQQQEQEQHLRGTSKIARNVGNKPRNANYHNNNQKNRNLQSKTTPSKTSRAQSTIDNNNDKKKNEDNDDDHLLEVALLVLLALLRVTPADKLDPWYHDMTGFESNQNDQKSKNNNNNSTSSPPTGLVLVSLLLDLLDYLLFVEWRKDTSPLNPKQVLTAGHHWQAPDNNSNNNNKCATKGPTSPRLQRQPPASTAIPRYYLAVIAILQQIGRTHSGMKVLRTRVKDDRVHDRMGNALDVSIRHLHALAWHWENHKVLPGAVLQLDRKDEDENHHHHLDNDDTAGTAPSDLTRSKPKQVRCDLCQRQRSALVDAVESWVRLWHQVLLFVQQCPTQEISYRSLVLELQDHYTSACAILLSSEDTRPEIQTMLRWHLEELAFDEEEFLEAEEVRKKKRSSRKGQKTSSVNMSLP
jgi:hypothetical protein